LTNLLWDGGNLIFMIEYDRSKRMEHVGGIEIGLTVGILCAKRWNDKNWKIWNVKRARPCTL